MTVVQKWVPDILGAPFEQLTLLLGTDAEGDVVATLVRSRPRAAALAPLVDVDVLYVHGWSDYFFQTDLARFWNRLGARFYALAWLLQRYGERMLAFIEKRMMWIAGGIVALAIIAWFIVRSHA